MCGSGLSVGDDRDGPEDNSAAMLFGKSGETPKASGLQLADSGVFSSETGEEFGSLANTVMAVEEPDVILVVVAISSFFVGDSRMLPADGGVAEIGGVLDDFRPME
jgi:hypothetical protein